MGSRERQVGVSWGRWAGSPEELSASAFASQVVGSLPFRKPVFGSWLSHNMPGNRCGGPGMGEEGA